MQEDRINTDQVEFYLRKIYADREGYVAVTYGHNPRTTKPRFAPGDMRQKFYSWPDEFDKLIEDVDSVLNSSDTRSENTEVFVAPSLRSTPSRKKGTNAPLHWVWADLDGTPSQSEMERVNALGAMTILSGTEGHRHVYLPLAKPVTPTTHEALCRALRAAINKDRKIADDKIAENDLLRLPGTLNWKTTNPNWVWLKSAGRQSRPAQWYADQLSSMTSIPFDQFIAEARDSATRSTSPTDTPDVPEDHPAPSIRSLPRPVRDAFRSTEHRTAGERSAALYHLVAMCKENGVSRADTHALCRTYPPAMDKWAWWQISNDVDRVWRKIKATQKTKQEQVEDQFSIEDTGDNQPVLMFHRWADIRERVKHAPTPQFLFNGIIVEGDYGVISALDKVGKSFIMGDAAVSCASGTPWMDKFETRTAQPVIMCVGEGGERKLTRRLEAIARHKDLSDREIDAMDMHFQMGVPSINDEDHLTELEEAVRRIKPGLVIIDPFYLAAAGINLSQINEVGASLAPLQAIVQRYNSALIISHHWNKTGTGDAHSRVSGSGLTAWGRFLISVSLESDRADPVTRRTTVTQRWHIKGDEVMTEQFDVERAVWVDDPEDLSSTMYYDLSLPDSADTERTKPIANAPTMAKISSYLEDYPGGAGVRAIMRDTHTAQGTAYKALEQLVLHGFVTRDARAGDRAPYVLVRPFTRDLLDADGRLDGLNDPPPSNHTPGIAQPRTLDMTDRPRSRRRGARR